MEINFNLVRFWKITVDVERRFVLNYQDHQDQSTVFLFEQVVTLKLAHSKLTKQSELSETVILLNDFCVSELKKNQQFFLREAMS